MYCVTRRKGSTLTLLPTVAISSGKGLLEPTQHDMERTILLDADGDSYDDDGNDDDSNNDNNHGDFDDYRDDSGDDIDDGNGRNDDRNVSNVKKNNKK